MDREQQFAMRQRLIAPTVTLLFLIGCLVGGFLWLKNITNEMMFVPKPHDTTRVQEVVRPLVGGAADTVRVVRVDKDTNGYFFRMSSESLKYEDLRKRLSEGGWDTSNSPTNKVVGRRAGNNGIEVVVFESFDESEFYCGYDLNETSIFWDRFEENRQYIGDP